MDDQVPAVPTNPPPADPIGTPPPIPAPQPAIPTPEATTAPTPNTLPTDTSTTPPTSGIAATPPLTTQQIVETDILDLLDLSGLAEEDKDKLRETMLTSIRDRVIVRVGELLPPAEFEKLKGLLETDGNDQAMQAILDTNGIDLQELTMEESILYKNLLATAANQLKRG